MNKTKLWKNPKFPDVEFLKAQFIDFEYAPHFHEDYALCTVESGVHAFYYRRENFAITPDYIVTCQPGEIHTGYPGDDTLWRFRTWYIAPSLVHEVAHELGYKVNSLPFINHAYFAHPYLLQALRTIHHQSEIQDSVLSQQVLLHEVLLLVLTYFSDIRTKPIIVEDENVPMRRAKDYMQDHYAEDVTLDDLASAAHLSKSYFIRAFRHHVGISPYAYFIQTRLNRAKTLLKQGHQAVDVALATGFFDQSHFTRYFKQFLGVTPGQYQQAIG